MEEGFHSLFDGCLDIDPAQSAPDLLKAIPSGKGILLFADPNDRASQETDIAIELRNRDRERKLIKKIEETIDHIESGEYGYCNGCGVEIGIKRLEARPTATLCIDCKTLEEVREKQVAK